MAFQALGDATMRHKGPAVEHIGKIREGLYRGLGVTYDAALQGSTEIDAQLHEAWIHAAEDPDVDILGWSRGGTPTGVEANMIPRGILLKLMGRLLSASDVF